MEENLRLRASRRSCRVMYGNIRGLHKNLSDLSLAARGEDVFFFLRLLSLPGAPFLSLWFRVSVDQFNCSKMKLISSENWLYTCVKAFWHIDSAVISVGL